MLASKGPVRPTAGQPADLIEALLAASLTLSGGSLVCNTATEMEQKKTELGCFAIVHLFVTFYCVRNMLCVRVSAHIQ